MNTLLEQDSLNIINVGLKRFSEDARQQNTKVTQVEWKPLAGGRKDIIAALDKMEGVRDKITEANHQVIEKIKASKPFLVDIDLAINCIPGMKPNLILHAGPPVSWDRMCGPMKGAVIGALLFEGLAETEDEAVALIESGKIEFAPCHEYGTVGPMAGIVCASMPVHIIHDKEYNTDSYCSVNEGLGKVLRFGAYSGEVLNRLRYLRDEFMPVMKKALALTDGIDIKLITAQALQMGDECHNRNKAATSLFYKQISLLILQAESDREKSMNALSFIAGNDHYFLNISMPACKIMLRAGENVPYSTILNVMARNGVDFGIKVSGIGSDQWFTGESQYIQGLYFPGYSQEDANRDIGDSAITETMGIGGFAMGGAPAIVQFVGGTTDDAIATSKRMYTITTDLNPAYSIPALNFKGCAMGIDFVKVIENDTLPVINTGIAHKDAGVGQIGAGIVSPPMECFYKALLAYVEKYQL
ncbi:MAG: DUF1116 domain-containing protein [Lachnospiraceae bacterium]